MPTNPQRNNFKRCTLKALLWPQQYNPEHFLQRFRKSLKQEVSLSCYTRCETRQRGVIKNRSCQITKLFFPSGFFFSFFWRKKWVILHSLSFSEIIDHPVPLLLISFIKKVTSIAQETTCVSIGILFIKRKMLPLTCGEQYLGELMSSF